MENAIASPLSQVDRSTLQNLVMKGCFVLLRSYSIFFIGLGYVYYKFYPRYAYKVHKTGREDMTASDYCMSTLFLPFFLDQYFYFFC